MGGGGGTVGGFEICFLVLVEQFAPPGCRPVPSLSPQHQSQQEGFPRRVAFDPISNPRTQPLVLRSFPTPSQQVPRGASSERMPPTTRAITAASLGSSNGLRRGARTPWLLAPASYPPKRRLLRGAHWTPRRAQPQPEPDPPPTCPLAPGAPLKSSNRAPPHVASLLGLGVHAHPLWTRRSPP